MDTGKSLTVQGGVLVLSGIGVIIGLGLAFGLTRLMTGLLDGVSPWDPVTFLSVAAGLSGVALAATGRNRSPAHG